jgi:hypothetical protein
VKEWSDDEVARRWWTLFPQKKDKTGKALEPTDADLGMMLNNPSRMAQIRERLSDVSWWMRCTAENIARRANKEENISGRFWQGRYRAQLILETGMNGDSHTCVDARWKTGIILFTCPLT